MRNRGYDSGSNKVVLKCLICLNGEHEEGEECKENIPVQLSKLRDGNIKSGAGKRHKGRDGKGQSVVVNLKDMIAEYDPRNSEYFKKPINWESSDYYTSDGQMFQSGRLIS